MSLHPDPLPAWRELSPWPLWQDEALCALEAFLAAPETRRELVEVEREERYPEALLHALCDRGALDFFSPGARPEDPLRFTACHLGALNSVLARHSGSLAISLGINGLALLPLFIAGTPAQLDWAFSHLRARRFAALGVTELEVGSDLMRTRTRATPEEDGFLVEGSKEYINGATRHHLLMTLVRTRLSSTPSPADFSLLAIERDQTVSPLSRWRTLPVRAADISGMRFSGTRVPRERLVGGEGQGFSLLQRALGVSRGAVGSLASGAATDARQQAMTYAQGRRLFDAPILALPQLAQQLLQMHATELLCAALAIKAVAQINLRGTAARYFTATAKYACSMLAEETAAEAKRLLSARAMVVDQGFERTFRDAQIYGIFEGTTHVMLGELQTRLAHMATLGGRSAPDEPVGAGYLAAPRLLLEVVRGSPPVHVPDTAGELERLSALDGELELWPLTGLARGLLGAVSALRAHGHWEAPTGERFELAGLMAELEALVALCELGDPRRRVALGLAALPSSRLRSLAVRYAYAWRGGRLVRALQHLLARAGVEPDGALASAERAFVALERPTQLEWYAALNPPRT